MKKYVALWVTYILSATILLKAQNSTIDSLREVIKSKTRQDTSMVDALNDLGNELLLKSQWEAMDSYQDAYHISTQINDTVRIVNSLIGLCDVYSMNGEYKKALEFITEALAYAFNNYDLLATCHSRLAIEYFNLKKNEESVKHHRLSLEYNLLINDSSKIAYDLHNIGTYFLGGEYNDSAIYYYNYSNSYINNPNDELIAYNNNRIGFAHSYVEEYDSALQYHLLAFERFAQDSMLYEMALEQTYLAILFSEQEKFKNALKHVNNAEILSTQLNNHVLIKTCHHLYYDIYDHLKEYKKALDHALLKQAYSDSIDEKNQQDIIQTLKTQQSYNEQKRRLKTAKENNSDLENKQHKLLIFSVIIIILLVICIVILVENRIKQRKNEELVSQLNKVNEYQKKLLAIIGHDLRDSVGNLKNFTELMHFNLLENKSINAMVENFVPMVNSTYDLLNNLLFWSKNNNKQFTPQLETHSNLSLIKDAIDHINHLAQAKHVTIENDIQPASFEGDRNMLLTILRNLLSNAIKFSYPNSIILIGSKPVDNTILISVCDKGVGMHKNQIESILNADINEHSEGTKGEFGSGLGLSLCLSFIKKLNGKITIESSPGKGSSFHLHLPQKRNQTIKPETISSPVSCWFKTRLSK